MQIRVLLSLMAALLCARSLVMAQVVTNSLDAGSGSLRQVIADATNGATITFDASLSGQTIELAGSDLNLSKSLNIIGPGPGSLAISAGNSSRVFTVSAGTTNSISGLAIRNGKSENGASGNPGDAGLPGGGIWNLGMLTLSNCVVAGNQAGRGGKGNNGADGTLGSPNGNNGKKGGDGGSGGAIYNGGTLTLIACTLTNNAAGDGGNGGNGGDGSGLLGDGGNGGNGGNGGDGGGIQNAGLLELRACTLGANASGNGGSRGDRGTGNPNGSNGNAGSAGLGGGIYTVDSLTLNNTTLVGNSAGDGGGIANAGSLVINSATLSGNSADDGSGGGILVLGGAVSLTNTIVAANIASSGPTNISGSFSGSNNLLSGDPRLAPLGDYGGPTQTIPPLAGSPAIDMGGPTILTTDQRGLARLVGSAVDIGAVEAGHPVPGVDYTLVVTTNDFLDSLNLNGVSLRDAVAFAPDTSTITFDASLSGQTIVLTNGQIRVTNNFTIDGSALADGITVDGNADGRIFEFAGGTLNVLDTLTLTGGVASGGIPDNSGGAIYLNPTAHLTVNSSTLSGNSAASGGGIFNDDNSMLTLNNSTLLGNSAADGFGGGILNFGSMEINQSTLTGNSTLSGGGGIASLGTNATLTAANSTLAGNTADFGGGILLRDGSLSVSNTTVSLNIGSNGTGGLVLESGNATLVNTIIAANDGPTDPDIGGSGTTLVPSGNNLIGRNDGLYASLMPAGLPNPDGNYVGTSGSPLNPLLAPLGDYGGPTQTMPPLSGSPAIDTGGAVALATDQRGLPRLSGNAVDIGAVELQSPVVLNANDSGAGSLRNALVVADSGATITFNNTLAGQTIVLNSGPLAVSSSLTIDASDLINGITIDGNAGGRIFEFTGGTTNLLDNLTLTGGVASGFDFPVGGAILVNLSADLTLNNSTLSGNSANSGGGIHNDGTLTLNNSTVSSNTATNSGGGIYNIGNLTLNNSTLSGNAAYSGGAIYNFLGSFTLDNSTLSGNTAYSGGGIYNVGNLTLNNSTLSGNAATNFGGGIYTDLTQNTSATLSATNSIIAGNTALFETNLNDIPAPLGANNLVDVEPLLAALGDYGGPTQTMPPLSGSPAIDAGIDTGSLAATDQRGLNRVVKGIVDIGAVEVQLIVAADPLVLTDLTVLGDGEFQFSFTNLTGASFSVFATTNVALPLTNWMTIGSAIEDPPSSGRFRFTDLDATNHLQRYYLVKSP